MTRWWDQEASLGRRDGEGAIHQRYTLCNTRYDTRYLLQARVYMPYNAIHCLFHIKC